MFRPVAVNFLAKRVLYKTLWARNLSNPEDGRYRPKHVVFPLLINTIVLPYIYSCVFDWIYFTIYSSGKVVHVKFPSQSREGSMLSPVPWRFSIIPLNRKGILSSVFHFFHVFHLSLLSFTSRTLLLSFMIFYSSLFWLFTFIISSVLFCFRVCWEGWGIRIHRTEKLQL